MKRSSRVLTDISTVVLSDFGIGHLRCYGAAAYQRVQALLLRGAVDASLSAYVGRMVPCALLAPLELVW